MSGVPLDGCSLTKHVCKRCGGRIIDCVNRAFCADCETEAEQIKALCCCGAETKAGDSFGVMCAETGVGHQRRVGVKLR